MHAQNIVHQGPVIGAIGRLAARVLWQRLRKPEAGAAPAVPGPVFEATLKPRPESLVRDYLRWCKADAGAYRGQLPGHLFPQWGFPLLSRTLEGLPGRVHHLAYSNNGRYLAAAYGSDNVPELVALIKQVQPKLAQQLEYTEELKPFE